MKLNRRTMGKMVTDATLVGLVAKCLAKEAEAELTREKVDEYVKPIFGKFEFYISDEWKEKAEARDVTRLFGDDVDENGKILNEESIAFTDLEGETYKAYLSAVRDAHLAGPFADAVLAMEAKHNADRGWCPALIAESAFRNAKNELADYAAKEWLGLESIRYPHSDKLVKLVIGAVLAGPAGESLKSPVAVGA